MEGCGGGAKKGKAQGKRWSAVRVKRAMLGGQFPSLEEGIPRVTRPHQASETAKGGEAHGQGAGGLNAPIARKSAPVTGVVGCKTRMHGCTPSAEVRGRVPPHSLCCCAAGRASSTHGTPPLRPQDARQAFTLEGLPLSSRIQLEVFLLPQG